MTWSGLGFVSQEMENAWNEYSRLERDVDWLKSALQAQMNRSDLSQVSVFELQAYAEDADTMQAILSGLKLV